MSIQKYIKRTWPLMVRSHQNLAQAAADPKNPKAVPPFPVYVSADEDLSTIDHCLRLTMQPKDFEQIQLRPLPPDPAQIEQHGLLYLPRPYVVPGGRFNEMYGWDSFFIQMGLLRDGFEALAKDLADNFLYEIHRYGKILNANRTYYLQRSQPPLLTQMILAIFHRSGDTQWLEQSLEAIDSYYRYWTTEPHLTPETGLSRYFDLGEGPASEVVSSEIDADGRTDYELVKDYFRTHQISDYDVRQFYDAPTGELTALFYKGDRSMRESGFDPSNRFGPFSADIIHYNPVCLNSLLYRMEIETGEILDILGRHEQARVWQVRALDRAARMNELLWDQGHGLYLDYHFVNRSPRVYPFLTTFYPLWAGIASPAQAESVVRNLPLFECRGGLRTSTTQTGDQWDSPMGWAPLHWFAVQGLRRFGYHAEADGVCRRFLALVQGQFQLNGTIEEKYDVVNARADLGDEILFGYRSNEAGFGWTNAVFTALFDDLQGKSAASSTGSQPASPLQGN
jgi:alpha,alpha-trehalase